MIKLCSVLLALGMATTASAQLSISIGVRETAAGGGSFTNIGGDGGASGGIEWVNLDGQTLTLDGTWQQFTFNLTSDPITAFAGSTANGVLDGGYGTLEHVRILNSGGIADPIELWIDDITDLVTGGATTFGDFEGYADGAEVVFQEPTFSGSTSSHVMSGATAGVDNYVASRTASDGIAFQFVDGTTTRWVRLTTFNATNVPNPLIRFDQGSVLTFWMRGGKAQPNVGSQGPGTAIAEHVGTGLNAGLQSTYYTGGAPAGAPGAVVFSIAGGSDVPFLGGNLVSFSNFITSAGLMADGQGRTQLTFPGDSTVLNLVMQSVFVDTSLPQLLTFTNAVEAQYGQ